MDKKISIGIMAIIVVIVLIGGYFAFIPHYKTIEMSGYTFEVPESNAEVKNNSVNYNTYLDTEYDLTIKTWACKDINDINGSINGSMEMGMQLGENMGSNVTLNNFTVYNKSGIYTYYEPDINNSCMIIITTKNLNLIEHILDTINKPQLNVDKNPFNMTASGITLKDEYNNTTTTTSNTKKSTQSTQKKQSASYDEEVEWYDIVVPGTDGKETVKARHDHLTPYGNRYITEDGNPIYV